MSQPPGHTDESPRGSPLTGWHYLLIFTAFGLVVLTVASSKYQKRQAQFEQRFQGIQEMQRHPPRAGGAQPDVAASKSEPKRAAEVAAPPVEAADQPLIVTLWPLMLILVVAMLVAWVGIQVRARRRLVPRPSTGGRNDIVT